MDEPANQQPPELSHTDGAGRFRMVDNATVAGTLSAAKKEILVALLEI